MLVVEQSKAVVLKLKNPAKVLESIPTAKVVEFGGKQYTAVPHKVDETKVLRNLGFDVPSPIQYYYDWPGRFRPLSHQRETADALTMHKHIIVLNEIGTGKTKAALWAADYLMRRKMIKKVLILSPLSTLDRVWGDEIFTTLYDRTAAVLHGDAKKRLKLLAQDHDFYIVNHDGFQIICDAAKGMFDLIIVDEAAVYRNPSTMRFKMLHRFMRNNPTTRLWLMTGTPTPNSPMDAWALAKLINAPNLPRYTAFRDLVMSKAGQFKWVAKQEALSVVAQYLRPSVRFTREACLDLPDTVYHTREVALTKEQKHAYDAMFKEFLISVSDASRESAKVTAANEAVKLQKLLQILLGVVYSDDGSRVAIGASPRINLVKEIIEECGDKVIVFVPLTGALHLLESELSKHYTTAVVNGQVNASARSEIFQNFQNSKDPQVLIAHPGTMAHGLTLTAATTIIWYGPPNSNEVYEQANGRIERIGKNKTSNVFHIESGPLERRMYKRLQNKQVTQGLLLELIKEAMK